MLTEELHFGRAARRLFLTQPALSKQIRALEDRLGVDLLQRSSRRVDLTAAGQALVPEARALVAAMTRLQGLAAAMAREARGLAPLTLAQLSDHVVVDVPAEAPRAWWDHWTVNPRPDGSPVRFGPPVEDIEAMLLAGATQQHTRMVQVYRVYVRATPESIWDAITSAVSPVASV